MIKTTKAVVSIIFVVGTLCQATLYGDPVLVIWPQVNPKTFLAGVPCQEWHCNLYMENHGDQPSPGGSTFAIYVSQRTYIRPTDLRVSAWHYMPIVPAGGHAGVAPMMDYFPLAYWTGVPVDAGTYYVGPCVDDEPFNFPVEITVTDAPLGPELCGCDMDYDILPRTVNVGGQITLSGGVQNAGTARAGVFAIAAYASLDWEIDPGVDYQIGDPEPFGIELEPGDSDSFTYTRTVNLPPGTYYVGWVIDSTNMVNERCETNNTVAPAGLTFTVTGSGLLTVLTPNGGESLTRGQAYTITWSSTESIANVRLEYSTNNGSTYTAIAASTTNDGSHSWTVPSANSTQCLVRISDASDASIFDVSDAVFSIASPSGQPELVGTGCTAVSKETGSNEVVRGDPLIVTLTVLNVGDGSFDGDIEASFSLSNVNSSRQLGSISYTTSLNAGDSTEIEVEWPVPDVALGEYHVCWVISSPNHNSGCGDLLKIGGTAVFAASFKSGSAPPPEPVIEPSDPTSQDVISVTVPTQVFKNIEEARQTLGEPTVQIDSAAKTVELYFEPVAPAAVPDTYAPICAIEFSFGPLPPGSWRFTGQVLDRVFDESIVISSSPVEPIPDALMAHWQLDETQGPTAFDSAGAHDGTLNGNPTWLAAGGVFGGALSFDGIDDYVNCGTFNPSAATGKLSICLWARWNGLTGKWQGLIAKQSSWGDRQTMWSLVADIDMGKVQFYHELSPRIGGDPVLPIGQWTHVAVSCDGTTATMYIDGEPTGSGPFSLPSATQAPVILGACQPDGQHPFNGVLDDIRLYDQGLSQEQVLAVMGRSVEPGRIPGGLVAHWELDETEGTTAHDTTGVHSGSLAGNPTWLPTSGQIGGALSFDGIDDHVNCGNFNPSSATGQLGVCLWAKWNGQPTNWQGLIAKRNGWGPTDVMWSLEADINTSKLAFFHYTSGRIGGDPVLPIGQWTHVAVSCDGTTATMYIDGEPTGSGPFSFPSATEAALVFGASTPEGYNAFNGALDDIQLYDRALSEADIKTVMTGLEGELEPSEPDPLAHWTFDETSGGVAADSAGYCDGLLVGEPIWQPSGGKVGGALKFDGSNDCVVTASVLNPADGPLSVFAWVQGGAGRQVIVSQDGSVGGTDWLGASLAGRLTSALCSPALTSSKVITDDQWHEVGLTWDGTSRTLYVDGATVATDKPAPPASSTGGLNIGTGKNLDAGTFWSGLIDDVRVYNCPLSESEIRAVMASEGVWKRQLGTSSFDNSTDLAADGEGNLYVVGRTNGSLGGLNAGGSDAYVAKLDAAGNLLWLRQFGTSAEDSIVSVLVDGHGTAYVHGRTKGSLGGPNVGDSDAFVAKLDSAGSPVWIRQYGTTAEDEPGGISVDSLGNAYAVGLTNGRLGQQSFGDYDAYLVKVDSNGNLVWTQQFGTSAMESMGDVSADNQGNVYTVGSTSGPLGGPNMGGSDAYVTKFSATGSFLWTHQFGTSNHDSANSASTDGLGNVYIAGSTYGSLGGTNAGGRDGLVSKFNSQGLLLWTRQFGTTALDQCWEISCDSQGNPFVCGETQGSLAAPNAGSFDVVVRKYDSEGNVLWTDQFGTSGEERYPNIAVDGLGIVYVSGLTTGSLGGPHAGDYDAFVVKLASN